MDSPFPCGELVSAHVIQEASEYSYLNAILCVRLMITATLFVFAATPMYSWTESVFKHPIMTIQSVFVHGFEEAIGGISGLFTSEVKNSCFSFAYRVNTIAPYTVVYPGGILGSIMKGLVRSYFLVFQQSLINFKGIFALLIGIICKTRIIQAAISAIKPIFRLARRGARAFQLFKSKTIGKLNS